MPNPELPVRAEISPVAEPSATRPVVASYIVTFLKPEMLHVYRQVSGLRRWDPHVICQKRENAETFPFANVTVVPKPLTHQLRRWWQKKILQQPIMIYRREARALEARLRASGARVLHVYFGHIGVHLLPLLEITSIQTVVSFHGADAQVNLDRPKHRAATQRMFERAKLLLVRSESLGERLIAIGCPKEKLRVHRTGLPLDELPFSQRTVPVHGDWHCVQASRLIEKKGLFTTLRAFAKFVDSHPSARLTLAGDGPLKGDLERLASELGIRNHIALPGFLDQAELRRLYAEAHLFLHPSQLGRNGDQEGVPNALLEAMATGLPPIATLHGGIPEAVRPGVSGLLVPEGDHETLAAEMLALAVQPSRYAEMSRHAAGRIREAFDLRVTVPVLEGIYDEAASLA